MLRVFDPSLSLPVEEIPDTVWLWLVKGLGAVLGSAVSIAYVLPKGRQEAAIRFVVGVLIGVVFGSLAGEQIISYLDILGELTRFEVVLMGSMSASLCAWWLLGFLRRFFDRQIKK